MFENHQYEAHRRTQLPSAPSLPYVSRSDVSEISLLVWGEHCIECAAPACYATCDLFDKRPDGRCRRFQYGAHSNPAFQSFRGYGTEVQFRKWGKIEARGNTVLAPTRSVIRYERAMNAAFRVMNPVGRFLKRTTGDDRWAYLSQSLHERLSRYLHAKYSRKRTPDAFLLELYNPDALPVTLHFSVSPSVENGKRRGAPSRLPPFRAALTAPVGYSTHEFDARLFRSITDNTAFDVSLTPEADTEPHLIILSADFVRFAKNSAAREDASGVKCVVWDLDNTIWDGVLLENSAVTLRPGIIDLLRYLDERGILLSIASKNDHESAWSKLEEFGIAHLFLYPQINWMPKSQNVKKIADLLDIGIDTFAFVDDNPFELEEVRSAHPSVMCVDAADMSSITAHQRLQGNTTADSRSRRLFYQQAIVREEEESRFGDDYLAFLASCGIRLQIGQYSPDDLDRVAELVQRTNQLNFSGRKYTRPELYSILEDSLLDKYVLRCEDKYGSYGIIGFSIVRNGDQAIRVEDFMVSCRVQGKFLEQAFFGHLRRHHDARNAKQLWVNFQPTLKNKPAQKVLETLGFESCAPDPGMTTSSTMECDFINVKCTIAHDHL